MRTRFIACGGCSRHVREGDAACPFCGAPAPAAPPVERVLARGLSRAAMLAAGTAGVVVAMADCGSSGNVGTTAFYGVPPNLDASMDASDAADGNVGVGVFYGVACPECDASPPAADASDARAADADAKDR